MACNPKQLYTKQPALKPITEEGMYENFGLLIPLEYCAETCPYSPLSSWIAVKKIFPVGIKMEKDFDGTNFLGEVTAIQLDARIYAVYILQRRFGKFLHKDEMKKCKVGTNILKL